MEKERPLNIVVGSPIKDGRCILIRRVKEPYKNYWSIPGGKLEYGENIAEAVERELLEETGIITKFSSLKGIVSEILRDHSTNKVKAHFLIWVCGLNYIDGEATEKNEGKVRWFSQEELDREKAAIIPSDYLMVKRFLLGDTAVANFHTIHMKTTDGGYEIEHTDL
ncbi:MAG: NUDIX domain-containing protein [bacterium]|nr:NUDIX domain-containing protein [bacterium]